MKQSNCSKTWQAEALEDGRLSEADSNAFQAHAGTCGECLAALGDLEWLRQVGARLPALESTPLAQRRQLAELRRRAFELSVAGSHHGVRSPRRRLALAWAFALVASLGCVVAVSWWRGATPSSHLATQPPVAAPVFEVNASPGARWETLENGSTVRLATRSGRVEIVVHKLTTGQRFLVTLPDGELEVKGTRFVVTTAENQTLGVEVSEGRVALRLRGQSETMLAAGERWPESAAAESPSRASIRTPGLPARPPPDAPAATPSAAPRAQHRRGLEAGVPDETTATNSAERGSEKSPTTLAGGNLEAALAAFEKGDYGRAEQLFLAFERANPGDARTEDAMFLTVVCRARLGDAGGARSAARRYLQRYPQGLRRVEAEHFAEGARDGG